MLQKINATKKGMLTGLLMIGLSVFFFYTQSPADSPYQYIIYIVYAAGIVWTVYDFNKNTDQPHKFGTYFSQAFKCFIVVTLLMVLFTFVFNKLHPEFKEQIALAYKNDLIKKGNSTPAEIDSAIGRMKNYYIVVLLAGSIFSYLLIGAVVSLITSLMFMRRKQYI